SGVPAVVITVLLRPPPSIHSELTWLATSETQHAGPPAGRARPSPMTDVTDIEVYQQLTEIADDLDLMGQRGPSLAGGADATTAARTVRGMASAVYQHIMADRGETLEN